MDIVWSMASFNVERDMKKESGFTLIELAVTVAIMAIMAAIVIPNMIGWMSRGRVNAAARDIVAAIQKARIEAVRQNAPTVVTFDSSKISDSTVDFLAFIDDGQGTIDDNDDGIPVGFGNNEQDGTERTIFPGRLPAGVSISSVSFGPHTTTSFNSRAIPSYSGPITLTNASGYTVIIRLNSAGIPKVE